MCLCNETESLLTVVILVTYICKISHTLAHYVTKSSQNYNFQSNMHNGHYTGPLLLVASTGSQSLELEDIAGTQFYYQ